MIKELPSLFECKNEIQRKWNQCQDTWNEYREVVTVSINEMRMVKTHLELKLAKAVKDNKKGFFNQPTVVPSNITHPVIL